MTTGACTTRRCWRCLPWPRRGNRPQLALYPNPACTAVTVPISGAVDARVLSVVNALGQQVRSRALGAAGGAAGQAVELPLAGLASGLYVVRYVELSQPLVVE